MSDSVTTLLPAVDTLDWDGVLGDSALTEIATARCAAGAEGRVA